MTGFLPMTPQEMRQQGMTQFDFIIVTGDAYVDHPSFGTAIISRVLQAMDFTVGIVAQPEWRQDRDFIRFGKPRYAFLVNAGNMDSMVAHYTSAKRKRSTDAYSPGNVAGKRPDRALTVYCQALKRIYPDVPVIAGGIEASLRRFAHYDYWDDAVHPSVLYSCGADLLVYGMGELQTREIASRLASGLSIRDCTDIRGTCYLTEPQYTPYGAVECPSFEVVSQNKANYAKATRRQMDEQDEVHGRTLVQRQKDKMLVQNSPMRSLTQEELDEVYALPYMRRYHPSYEAQGGVPALQEVQFSITHNRGCFGACNFCSIAFHQGRKITCRSKESVLREAELLTQDPDFKGYIHDVGGPTANFRKPSCQKQLTHGLCKGKKCLAPKPCPQLEVDHSEYLELLDQMRRIPGIKKVFIRSGIRYDYLLQDDSDAFFKALLTHHVSGQLKVAPEHCADSVLDCMGKSHFSLYRDFQKRFYQTTRALGKAQFLVPYFMSSHPGCTLEDAVSLAEFFHKEGIRPQQVQDFYPTPGTVSTCMYYTGLNPYTMQEVYVPRTAKDKQMQRALLQYFLPEHKETVYRVLKQLKRFDLIGNGPKALVGELHSTSSKQHFHKEKERNKTWQKRATPKRKR